MLSRKEFLMDLLTKKTRELQRKVTYDDMCNDPKMPPPNDYAFYAGSFDNAATEVWNREHPQGRISLKKRRDSNE